MVLCKGDKNHIQIGIGDLLSSLEENFQKDIIAHNSYTEFEGKKYYFGKGDGSDVELTENGKIVTVTFGNGNTAVFERTGENTLKCISYKPCFYDAPEIPAGSVLTFKTGTFE